MIYNQSLKEFIKSFLKDIQKQGNIESRELFSPKKNQNNEINLSRFKNIIEIILKLFWRLVSNNTRTKDSQEDNDQFTESYLGDLIFKGYSIENFIDLVYVYGRSNSSVVQNILARLGELSPDKLISQFNDSLTSSLRILKNHVKAFWTLAKSFYDPSGLTNTDDWPDRIKFWLEDSISEMNDIYLFAKHFPNIVSPTVWSSDILIILSNYYMLIKEHKSSIWEFHFFNKISLELLTTHLKKLIYKSIVTFLRKHYFGIIGNWGNNFAKKQSELAKSITHFILQMTGNEVIHKDSVPSNNSIIEKNGGCQSFFKKILKSIEFEPYFFQLEDWVMQNRELLTNILSSVYPHEERNNAELEMVKRLSRKQSKAESSRKQQVIPESSSGLNRKMKELENYVPSNTSYLVKDDGESLKINYDDEMSSFKRNYDEEDEEFSLKIDNDAQKMYSNSFEQEETIITSKPQDNKAIENIDPQFLIKSEQDKIERKKKKKKLKNLWKDHVTVLKQMEAEKQKEFDEVKRKTLWLAENIEYEDEFDDIALEKQTSKASGNFKFCLCIYQKNLCYSKSIQIFYPYIVKFL